MTGDTQTSHPASAPPCPTRWFPDDSPVLDVLLTGLAAAWSQIYALLGFVRTQSRILPPPPDSLPGYRHRPGLLRHPPSAPRAEPDTSYRKAISTALCREHATRRGAAGSALQDLTGRTPGIFEPARPTDTGAYAGPGLGYGVAGAWGSLALPFQVFRRGSPPIAARHRHVAGYGTAGPLARASLAQIRRSVVTDTDIYAAIKAVLPTASTAWTRITN